MKTEHQGGVDAALLEAVWFWSATNERYKITQETSMPLNGTSRVMWCCYRIYWSPMENSVTILTLQDRSTFSRIRSLLRVWGKKEKEKSKIEKVEDNAKGTWYSIGHVRPSYFSRKISRSLDSFFFFTLFRTHNQPPIPFSHKMAGHIGVLDELGSINFLDGTGWLRLAKLQWAMVSPAVQTFPSLDPNL